MHMGRSPQVSRYVIGVVETYLGDVRELVSWAIHDKFNLNAQNLGDRR